ncbi:tachykinin family [Pyrenophora seminiperda CCB06]|uniref:Tachykinin family n=1 Tax=Pyrenophora seminiperda CCB06 TaxID=1302712 RepID=A0A3M7LYH5_9PLEO|nr:tachykinin family [Pyrenophora seminiperda CCB06]
MILSMAPPTVPSNGDSYPPKELPDKVKAKRRARARRDGPPQLQFVTATDLSQFRGEDAKRSVRSQAMIYHRSKHNTANSGLDKLTAGRGKGATGKGPTCTKGVSPTNGREKMQDKDLPSLTFDPLLGTTSPALTCALSDEEEHGPSADVTTKPDSRDQQCFAFAEQKISKATRRVVNYEYTGTHQERQIRRLLAKTVRIRQLVDTADPFGIIPRYKSAGVDSRFLTHISSGMLTFATDACLSRWFQGDLKREIILSACVLTSAWIDMRAGCLGDSTRTTIAKMETMRIASERLARPDTQLDDSTLMVLLHLLVGEVWSCNEKTLRTHLSGIAHFISQRGGMYKLGNPVFAETSAASCYHIDIVCETKPISMFESWEPAEYAAADHRLPIPESPIFCPSLDFATIPDDLCCSTATCALLRDMRDLTNLFVLSHGMFELGQAASAVDIDCPGFVDTDYKSKAAEIRKRLTSLPSAHTPGLTTSNDWVYEACRIAALIYAASIIFRLPFSVTADPRQNPLATESELFGSADAGRSLGTTRLSDVLYEVLIRTDLDNVWGNMCGVLYWVCMVGAVAARSPDTVNVQRVCTEAKAMRIRRCLILTSLRVMVVLIFHHPMPVLQAQKRLLKVQELIGTYAVGSHVMIGSTD